MSIRYSMVKFLINLIQAKKFTSLPIPELLKKSEQINRLFTFKLPENKKDCIFSDEVIEVATDGPYYYEKKKDYAENSASYKEKDCENAGFKNRSKTSLNDCACSMEETDALKGPDEMNTLKSLNEIGNLNEMIGPNETEALKAPDEISVLDEMNGLVRIKKGQEKNRFHCLHIKPLTKNEQQGADKAAVTEDEAKKADTAILHIYGGAMIFSPLPFQRRYAAKMARLTGREVYFPYYPLCTHYNIKDALTMLLELYRKILTRHKNVYLYGYSSGAALAMLMCAVINERKLPLPLPEKQVIISPGGVTATLEEAEAMEALDNKDILISSDFLTRVKPLLTHGNKDIPHYMTTFEDPDMSVFPETYCYYGSDECLSVKAEAYIELFKKNKVKFKAKKAPGMAHCYCVLDSFPEAKKDYYEIIEILKS